VIVADEREALLAAIDRLAPTLAGSGLAELEIEVGDIGVRLARPQPRAAPSPSVLAAATQPAAAAIVPTASPPSAAPAAAPFGAPAPGMRWVTAPLTGVWYTAPSPGARPYVQAGDEIHAGQVIGLIEAMKLFNEIKSDAGGRVTRILADTGTLVKRQQPLLEIDPG
jgi:acetyl-CoA carboxylase biotin carboxyl carrier protein